MTETKRIYNEVEKQVYAQRRDEIGRFGYEKAFGVEPSYEKFEYEKNNNRLRGEW